LRIYLSSPPPPIQSLINTHSPTLVKLLCDIRQKGFLAEQQTIPAPLTSMQMGLCLINGHMPVHQKHITGSFNIVSISGHGCAAWPFFINDTVTIIFELPSSIVDALLYQNVIYMLCWKSTIHSRLSYTFSPLKTAQNACCSLVDTERKVTTCMLTKV
jgi:hypothetical protein